jgi:serine/threonine protein phosphatase PrpC
MFPIEQNTNFLIMASDGLWDVCQDQKAVDMVKNFNSSKDMAKKLVQFALKNGTQDNVSVLILKFK